MSALYRSAIDEEWRVIDELARVEKLTAELYELVRRHDRNVDQWPDELMRLSYFVVHGLDTADSCERCGSDDVQIGRLWCSPCCDADWQARGLR